MISDEVRNVYASRSGGAAFEEWVTLFAAYSSAHPYLAGEFSRRMKGELPAGWKDNLPRFPAEKVCRHSHLSIRELTSCLVCRCVQEMKAVGTRNHSEEVLNAIAAALPEIMGGSADLTPSNLTNLKVSHERYSEVNLWLSLLYVLVLCLVVLWRLPARQPCRPLRALRSEGARHGCHLQWHVRIRRPAPFWSYLPQLRWIRSGLHSLVRSEQIWCDLRHDP